MQHFKSLVDGLLHDAFAVVSQSGPGVPAGAVGAVGSASTATEAVMSEINAAR